MPRIFTQAQLDAINSDEPDICVAAGAGSGKTGVLVERFVRLVEQKNVAVDQLLVITFTDRATREMKVRIVDALTERGLMLERRQVETAYISTIHGFCARLLQENPFEAGIDPQFKVLEEGKAKRLLRQTLEETVSRAYGANDQNLMTLVEAIQTARVFEEVTGDPLSVLGSSLQAVLDKLRGAGRTMEELDEIWKEGPERLASRSLSPLQSILQPSLTEISSCLQGIKQLRQKAVGALGGICDSLLAHKILEEPNGASPSEILDAVQSLHALLQRSRQNPQEPLSPEGQIIKYILRMRSLCDEMRSLFNAEAVEEEISTELCHTLLGLTIQVWKEYQAAKRRLGVLDNADLQSEGVRLLKDSIWVRNRYRRHFKYLLIDEFQDTDPLQMQLVELLHGANQGIPDQRHTNSLFIVGDVQQSIYGFRNAEPRLFQELERKFREDKSGKHISLQVNFRSRPEVLRTVSHVFRQVWKDVRSPFVPLETGAEFKTKTEPTLELMLSSGVRRGEYVALEADAIAARIQEIVEGRTLRISSKSDTRCGEFVRYKDIAILLRALTDIQKYSEAFAKRGVPHYIVGGGRGYYARREIRDLINILTVIDSPLDDVALAAALRSPLVGLELDTLYSLTNYAKNPDKKSTHFPLYSVLQAFIHHGDIPEEERSRLAAFIAIVDELRLHEDRLPVGHLLERLIARTGYDARLLCRPGGRRRLANVRKLLQMANTDSVMGVSEFIMRLQDLEKLADREGDAPTEEEAADVVRFLTIHSAKGLEFPVVVLADLSRNLVVQEKKLFVCDPEHIAFGTRLPGGPNAAYRAIVRQKEIVEESEFARLLYVAVTRSREHLILAGNAGNNRGFNWADLIFQSLGVLEPPPQPELKIVAGGIPARISALSHSIYSTSVMSDSNQNRPRYSAAAEELAQELLSHE